MKIVIDTKTDSVEEIQKAIQILSSLISQQSSSNQGDLFGSEIKPVETGVFNIFGNTESKTGNETITAGKKDDKEERNIDLLDLEEYR